MKKDGPLLVRPAVPADADQLGEIGVRAGQAGHVSVLPAEHLAGMSVAQRQSSWHAILADPAGNSDRPDVEPADNYVAQMQGRILGFITVGGSRDADAVDLLGEVYAIYVAPEAWGTGTAAALMERGLDRLRERGCTCSTLWVIEGSHRAQRFYEKTGFTLDGCSKPYARGDWTRTELRYRREL